MGTLTGLTPWIVYWILVGNVPLGVAVLVALACAVGAATHARSLEIGALVTFSALTVLTFTLDESFLRRWMLSLSIAGLLLGALVGALTGRPFGREAAAAGQPPDVVTTEPFGRLVTALSRLWVATFAVMAVSSAIPAALNRNATFVHATAPLSYLCFWVIPFGLLGLVVLASRQLAGRMLAGVDDVVRQTSFVAYDEATIDELYYLAREHASREVGPGKEAYNVKVGGMGTPLTGDESRKSWPSTYKVRDTVR